MATWLFCGCIVLVTFVLSAEAKQYSFEVHTHSEWGNNGGSSDTIYWRLCHDTNGNDCGLFQRNIWRKNGKTYSETYKVQQDLGTIKRVDIVNEGIDVLGLDWIKVDGKQYKCPYRGCVVGYYGSSKGCGVRTVYTTNNDWGNNQQNIGCPYNNLDVTYAPTRQPTVQLTDAPTKSPSVDPTNSPTTNSPTRAPTKSHVHLIERIEGSKLKWHGLIFCLFLVLSILAIFEANCCRKNDYFEFCALFKGMIGVLHVVTDVLFASLITARYRHDKSTWNLVFTVIAWTTIVLPTIFSFGQLCRMVHGEWTQKEGVRQWIIRYSHRLYILSFVCGNAFAAIGLVNSNAFRLKIFSMGLQQRDLSEFNIRILISVVIFEVIFFSFCVLSIFHFVCDHKSYSETDVIATNSALRPYHNWFCKFGIYCKLKIGPMKIQQSVLPNLKLLFWPMHLVHWYNGALV